MSSAHDPPCRQFFRATRVWHPTTCHVCWQPLAIAMIPHMALNRWVSMAAFSVCAMHALLSCHDMSTMFGFVQSSRFGAKKERRRTNVSATQYSLCSKAPPRDHGTRRLGGDHLVHGFASSVHGCGLASAQMKSMRRVMKTLTSGFLVARLFNQSDLASRRRCDTVPQQSRCGQGSVGSGCCWPWQSARCAQTVNRADAK